MIIPKSWNDVTLYQYQELLKSMRNGEDMLDIFSILLNTTPDDPIIEDMDYDEVKKEIDELGWLKLEPIGQLNSKIDEYTIKSFKNITLGEFIDIEHYYIEAVDNLHIISSILYRKQMIDKWGNIEWEPYEYNIESRSEIFLDQPITKVVGVLNGYIDFRTKFLNSYENLFQESNNDDFEELTGREKIDAQKEEMENKAKSKWSWESILLGLSNNDVTKFDDLFKTSLILVFNTLSAKKVLGI
jgi:hypothetical protein